MSKAWQYLIGILKMKRPCKRFDPLMLDPFMIAILLSFVAGACAKPPLPGNRDSIPDEIQSQVQTEVAPITPPVSTELAPPNPAGTVTSGGGLIFGSKGNPWFLDDQASPTWCVVIDSANFGMTIDAAESQIVKALNAWEAVTGIPFVKTECNDKTDLRILLGTLSPQDVVDVHAAVSNDHHAIDESIGLAVRTHYDEGTMRGRGFIYIGAESGPLKIKSPRIVEHPWQIFKGEVFRVALMHELGHVFGLQHTPEGDDLMGSRTLEYLLNSQAYEDLSFDPLARARFYEKLNSFSPLNLIRLPNKLKTEQCLAGICTKVLIDNPASGGMMVWVWTKHNDVFVDSDPSVVSDSDNKQVYQLESVTTLRLSMVDIKPISRVFRDGEFFPGFIATKATYCGVMEDGSTMILNWTAGQRPQVMVVNGEKSTWVIN